MWHLTLRQLGNRYKQMANSEDVNSDIVCIKFSSTLGGLFSPLTLTLTISVLLFWVSEFGICCNCKQTKSEWYARCKGELKQTSKHQMHLHFINFQNSFSKVLKFIFVFYILSVRYVFILVGEKVRGYSIYLRADFPQSTYKRTVFKKTF